MFTQENIQIKKNYNKIHGNLKETYKLFYNLRVTYKIFKNINYIQL